VAIDGDFVLYIALHGHTKGLLVTPAELAKHVSHWLLRAKQAEIQTIFVTTGGPPPVEKQNHCSVLRKRKRDRQQERIDELTEQAPLDDLGDELHRRDRIVRLQDNIRTVSTEMSRLVVDLLRADGWDCRQARSEADFLLVQLSEEGLCDYVATDDADIIVSGATHILRGFIRLLTDPHALGKIFCRADILACLHLTSDALLQLGVLLSCDYQAPIKNVGPVTAYRVIQEFGSVSTFLRSTAFNVQTKSKKRKYTLPDGMSVQAYQTKSSRSVDIFRSRPDRVQLSLTIAP
jgi:5'-3' exonuclease